ncbi:MAG: tRNA-guanine transglycosylase, partial [Candidatus Firestonebacteria bacterium]
PECDCYTCKNFTKSYLRHLANSGEYTGKQLNTLHNLAFMIKLLATIKTAIKEDRFLEAKEEFFKKYNEKQQ